MTRPVLSMVDIDSDILPSKSTAAIITSELGLVARQQTVPRPEGLVLNTLSDTSILQLLYSSVLSIYNCKASISYLTSLIKDFILLHCTPLSNN
jgi:hypothetical protein